MTIDCAIKDYVATKEALRRLDAGEHLDYSLVLDFAEHSNLEGIDLGDIHPLFKEPSMGGHPSISRGYFISDFFGSIEAIRESRSRAGLGHYAPKIRQLGRNVLGGVLGKAFDVGGESSWRTANGFRLSFYFDLEEKLSYMTLEDIPKQTNEKLELGRMALLKAINFAEYANANGIAIMRKVVKDPSFDIYQRERQLNRVTMNDVRSRRDSPDLLFQLYLDLSRFEDKYKEMWDQRKKFLMGNNEETQRKILENMEISEMQEEYNLLTSGIDKSKEIIEILSPVSV